LRAWSAWWWKSFYRNYDVTLYWQSY